MTLPILLGRLAAPLWPSLIQFSADHAVPAIQGALTDPNGFATRIGDVVVWNGEKGQTVLAGLQQVRESQIRIESAVNAIETAQIGLESAIGGLQTVAMATLGVTSLSGAFMIWRLQSLNKRFDGLVTRINDLEDNLDAQNKAHLKTAVQKLREFDDTNDTDSVGKARDEAQHAANVYGQLAYKETQRKKPRLEVLNYRGRCYLLSLLTELRSRLLLGSVSETTTRFTEERPLIEMIAKSTFANAIQDTPEAFLSHAMREQGITLELMTDLYRHASRYDAIDGVTVRQPSDMFELCRTRGIVGKSKRWWPFAGSPATFANRIKYALACFEDIGRVEALHLLAEQFDNAKITITELQKTCADWANQNNDGEFKGVLVYAFPGTAAT